MYTIDIDIYSFIEYLEVDTHTNRHTQTHISSLSPTHTLLDCSFICFFLLTLSILVGRATLLPRSRRRGAAGASGQTWGCTFYSLPGCIRVSCHTPTAAPRRHPLPTPTPLRPQDGGAALPAAIPAVPRAPHPRPGGRGHRGAAGWRRAWRWRRGGWRATWRTASSPTRTPTCPGPAPRGDSSR